MSKKEEVLFIALIGKKIREIRINSNLSQEMLANDADIPINQIGRIERSEINTSIVTLYKICKALNVNVCDILPFSKIEN